MRASESLTGKIFLIELAQLTARLSCFYSAYFIGYYHLNLNQESRKFVINYCVNNTAKLEGYTSEASIHGITKKYPMRLKHLIVLLLNVLSSSLSTLWKRKEQNERNNCLAKNHTETPFCHIYKAVSTLRVWVDMGSSLPG